MRGVSIGHCTHTSASWMVLLRSMDFFLVVSIVNEERSTRCEGRRRRRSRKRNCFGVGRCLDWHVVADGTVSGGRRRSITRRSRSGVGGSERFDIDVVLLRFKAMKSSRFSFIVVLICCCKPRHHVASPAELGRCPKGRRRKVGALFASTTSFVEGNGTDPLWTLLLLLHSRQRRLCQPVIPDLGGLGNVTRLGVHAGEHREERERRGRRRGRRPVRKRRKMRRR